MANCKWTIAEFDSGAWVSGVRRSFGLSQLGPVKTGTAEYADHADGDKQIIPRILASFLSTGISPAWSCKFPITVQLWTYRKHAYHSKSRRHRRWQHGRANRRAFG